jgi:hypothetical protein
MLKSLRAFGLVLVWVLSTLAGHASALSNDTSTAAIATNLHWAFEPVTDPRPPEVRHRRWPNNDVDRFILAKLEAAGRPPALAADKRTLIRRATFDVTGLPPTPEEVERFLKDASPRAFNRLVERLLASPHYGERWGRHWLDVVRYADTAGDSSDFPIPQASRYRNYVIDSFNSDRPYHQFLREQIAGDLLPAGTQAERNEQTIATGFIALSRRFGAGEGVPHLTIEDTLETIGRAVLGLSLSCARCHDHKHEPVTMRDYYGLYGVFSSTRYPHPGSEVKNRQADFVPLVPQAEFEARTKPFREALEAAGADIARLEKEAATLHKQGLSTEATYADLEAAKKRRAELLASPPDVPTAYAVAEGASTNARVQLRGDPSQPGAEAPRGFLKVLGGQTLPAGCPGSGRLELAGWLTSPTNPLTARVLVNRLWQHQFGRGLVSTPNDFGTQGRRPTHPELLDWLASRFIESGWSVKAVHRLILNSAAYQQASVVSIQYSVFSAPAVDQAVATGRSLASTAGTGSLNTDLLITEYFSPFPCRRLDAEQLRDALLAVSGELDPAPGGAHPFPPEHTWAFTQHAPFDAVYESRKRSVYLMQQRIRRHPYLALFDGADPNASTGERGVTTTPLQALFAMNDKFAHEQAAAFARRLMREREEDRSRVERAYQLAFARRARPDEVRECLACLDAVRTRLRANGIPAEEQALRAWSSVARALLGSNEFLFID